MGIYLGDKQGTLYKGSYKPVNIYHGSKKAAGWENETKTGETVEFDNTYNDFAEVLIGGRTEQVQTVQGKNLFDGKLSEGFISTGTGSNLNWGSTYKRTEFVPIPSNADYFISRESMPATLCAFYYEADKTYLSWGNLLPSEHPLAFISPPNTSFVRIAGTANIMDTITQLELGSTATSYEPFTPDSPSPEYPSPIISTGEVSGIDLTVTGNAGQSYQVHRDIVLRSLPDGTHDTWGVLTGTVTRNVGVMVLNGTEGWSTMASEAANKRLVYRQVSDVQKLNLSHKPRCTHFFGQNSAYWSSINCPNNSVSFFNSAPTIIGFVWAANDVSAPQSTTEWSAFLAAQYAAGTPVTVKYQLATPITTYLTPAQVSTYYPTTIISTANAEIKPTLTAKVRVVEK